MVPARAFAAQSPSAAFAMPGKVVQTRLQVPVTVHVPVSEHVAVRVPENPTSQAGAHVAPLAEFAVQVPALPLVTTGREAQTTEDTQVPVVDQTPEVHVAKCQSRGKKNRYQLEYR